MSHFKIPCIMVLMTDTEQGTQVAHPAGSSGRPERHVLLSSMLGKTARGGVPIRRAFIQHKEKTDGSRGAALGELVRTRDESALDAYLLIHAMASSSTPYRTWFPSATWAQITGLDSNASAETAKARWSKIATKLERLGLIRRERSGNRMNYWLLNESGNGDVYLRPKVLKHGSWFSVPHLYWTEGHDQRLTLPEKAMLLITLDQADDRALPYHRVPEWYGISKKTAERGLTGLLDGNYLTMRSERVVAPRSQTGWTEIRRYTTIGPWSIQARADAIRKERPKGPARHEADLPPEPES